MRTRSPWMQRARGPFTTSLGTVAAGLVAASIADRFAPASSWAGVTIIPLVLEGDALLGIGTVTLIESVSVNDRGDWTVEVDTDQPLTGTDAVVLINGVPTFREGQPLTTPPGTTMGAFDSVFLSPSGAIGWNLGIGGGVPTNLNSGVFIDTSIVIRESDMSSASGISPNSPFVSFSETRLDGSGRLFIVAAVDDPAIASTSDRVILRVDGALAGPAHTETLVAKEGDLLPGQTEAVLDFGQGPESFAINGVGDVVYTVSLAGASATNGAIYRNGTLIAQKGGPSSVPGRNYANIGTSTRLDVNDAGQVAFAVTLTGDTASDLAIVRDGTVVIREGDAPGKLVGLTVTGFGTAPLRIDSSGRVIWYAALSGPTATNQAILRDQEVVVQKGVTTVDGQTLTTIAGTTSVGGITRGFWASPNGKYVIFRGVLDGVTEGAFLATFDDELGPDLTGDGRVDGADLALLLGAWGTGAADLTGDGITNGADLAVLLGAWAP